MEITLMRISLLECRIKMERKVRNASILVRSVEFKNINSHEFKNIGVDRST